MNNYKQEIKVTTTPSGDKVITMPESVYIALTNRVFEASMREEEHNYNATAHDTLDMYDALVCESK